MKTLTDNFNKAYPNFASIAFTDACVIEEPANAANGKFHRLTLTGFNGYGFPHNLVSQTASFATASQKGITTTKDCHYDVLRKDCDKVILFERAGQKYMLFCELKSTFSTQEVFDAKDQIVGSLVKIRSLFQSIQGVNVNDYKPIGLIVSFKPTAEQLNALSKNEDRKTSFAIFLVSNRKYPMTSLKTDRYFHPLAVGDLDLFYLPIPDRNTSFTEDINSILK